MGNRPGTDDGWTYRGRGPIQVTGRANYRECGESIGVDLLAAPELLAERATGCMSTAWYWRKHKLAALGGDVRAVTLKINGGDNGLDDRRRRYVNALEALKT
jgi:putative chitinase